MLLPTWYNLSDMGVEDMVNDTLSANAFCGLRVEDTVSDHSTLSRFRSELSDKRAMNRLLTKLNSQFEQHGITVRKSGMIDAPITPTPQQSHSHSTYVLEEDPNTPLTKGSKPERGRPRSLLGEGRSYLCEHYKKGGKVT